MIYFGIPPNVSDMLGLYVQQLRAVMMIVWLRYQLQLEYQKHLGLSPSEQYRRHLRAGGWAAY